MRMIKPFLFVAMMMPAVGICQETSTTSRATPTLNTEISPVAVEVIWAKWNSEVTPENIAAETEKLKKMAGNLAKPLSELITEGKLVLFKRYRISALEGFETSVQEGSLTPTIVGANTTARGTSYNTVNQELGTRLLVMPVRADEKNVVLSLSLDGSGLETDSKNSVALSSEADAARVNPTFQFQLKSQVIIRNGESVVLSDVADDSQRQLVIVSVKVAE